MIVEVVDKNSGAILFKKDKESLTLEAVVKELEELKKKNSKLEKRIKALEESLSK